MRSVVRNSFARHSILAERQHVGVTSGCTECGQSRQSHGSAPHWLYRFHIDDDQGSRHSGPIADGKLFCSRNCAESYIGHSFDETKG